MAKETKSANSSPTKGWRKLETLPPDMTVELKDKECTTYYGTINGIRGYYLIVLYEGGLYFFSFHKENLSKFKNLKKRLEDLNCKFKPNEAVDPCTDSLWTRYEFETNLSNYEGRISSNRDYIIVGFGKHCCKMPTKGQRVDHEIDWIETLGVFMHW